MLYEKRKIVTVWYMLVHETVLFLFELGQCVEHAYYKLNQCTHGVSEKFKYFVSFLRQNCIINKSDAVNI